MRTIPMQFSALIVIAAAACSGPDDGTERQNGGSVSTGGTTMDGTGGVPSATGGQGSGGFGTGGGSGECTNIRPTGTQWDEATCEMWATQTDECNQPWMIENNYCNESCGRCTSNPGGTGGFGNPGTGGFGNPGTGGFGNPGTGGFGNPGTGGTGNPGTGGTGNPGTGGTGNPGTGGFPPSTCTDANDDVCRNQIGQHCGLTFEYWKDNGEGCMTNTADGFNIQWSNINNLLARKGVRPGSASNIVHYEATYNPNGNSYLCVYGWTKSPLVEYYIIESFGSWEPPGQGAESGGTIDSDGGTYKLFKTMRYNAPSIEGDSTTFPQYWSVRTAKRTSGTVTVKNHFDAWASKGWDMGSLYEVSMTVEGYQSSGSANVKVSIE